MVETDSLHGSLDLLVLKILSRRPPLHGYAIMATIAEWIKKDTMDESR
jgi:DNA-binding PadR family transcriptional regulator